MSDFMVSIEAGGLMHRPPESKVMPLPTSATEPFGFDGDQVRVTSRGGFAEPWPTPTMPPNPPLTSAFSSSTVTLTLLLAERARAVTESANDLGNSWLGGVFTRSRA